MNQRRNSSYQKPKTSENQSRTNKSYEVERALKKFPDSAEQEVHAKRSKSHLGNKSSPSLQHALFIENRKHKNISKRSTLQGRLDEIHHELSNSGNFQSVN